jgi:hypothetical protein
MTETGLRPAANDLAAKINGKLSEINAFMLNVVPKAVELGDLLKRAEHIVGHGNFLSWLEANCPALTERTAQRYMWYADHKNEIEEKLKAKLNAKSVNLADLTLGQARQLVEAKSSGCSNQRVERPNPVAKAKEIKGQLLDQLKAIRLDDQQKAKEVASEIVLELAVNEFVPPPPRT